MAFEAFWAALFLPLISGYGREVYSLAVSDTVRTVVVMLVQERSTF